MTTKEQEKEMLWKLAHSDTYFADTFSLNECMQMCKNIDDDFPLLMGTGFVKLSDMDVSLIRNILIMYLNILKNTPKLMLHQNQIVYNENLGNAISECLEKLNNR